MTTKHATLDEAFVAAQAAMEQPKKTAENPHFKSKFAPLDECIAAAVPVLNAHGIGLIQPIVYADGKTGVNTRIFGYGSERDLGTVMGEPPNDPQKLGSWITYMRRYGLNAGLAQAAETDDDAESVAHRNNPPAAKPQDGTKLVRAVWGKAKALSWDEAALSAWLAEKTQGKYDHPDTLPSSWLPRVLDAMQALIDEQENNG